MIIEMKLEENNIMYLFMYIKLSSRFIFSIHLNYYANKTLVKEALKFLERIFSPNLTIM